MHTNKARASLRKLLSLIYLWRTSVYCWFKWWQHQQPSHSRHTYKRIFNQISHGAKIASVNMCLLSPARTCFFNQFFASFPFISRYRQTFCVCIRMCMFGWFSDVRCRKSSLLMRAFTEGGTLSMLIASEEKTCKSFYEFTSHLQHFIWNQPFFAFNFNFIQLPLTCHCHLASITCQVIRTFGFSTFVYV